MHKPRNGKQWFLVWTAAFFAVALLLFWIVRDDWAASPASTQPVNRGELLAALAPGGEVRQTFTAEADTLESLTLDAEGGGEGMLSLRLTGEGGAELAAWQVPAASFAGPTFLPLPTPVTGCRGQALTLTLTSDSPVSLWTGITRSTARMEVTVETSGLTVNGEARTGELVLSQAGTRRGAGTVLFWPAAAALYLAVTLAAVLSVRREKRGKHSRLMDYFRVMKQYSYLLRTLVTRDFKVKYKASVLGMLWSVLNPLLMMMVYYFVFSTIFRSSIENFAAYLMCGIVVFNYFSESTNLGLNAIVGNAALITKVYMPKFIYPLSKVLSSAINLVLSLVPLLVIMLFSGTAIHRSVLLIPFVVMMLVVFCTGLSMLLSSAMVFFRDTQFLWGVLVTIWNFLTPIFYPETIIPARFLTVYRMNPLYQFITFLRSITMGGTAPAPLSWLWCLAAAFGTFAVGYLVFRRTQDRFVLYL